MSGAADTPERARRHAEQGRASALRRDAEARTSTLVARLRLATFLPAAACVIWAASRGPAPVLLVAGLLLFLAFAVLVVWHARVEDRIAWFDALRVVHERAAARVTRTWASLPAADPPADLDLSGHPYAVDLDLFGRASLYQWLGPAATVLGGRTLASWLLAPADRHEIAARQEAVSHLAPAEDWREGFAARGLLSTARQPEIDRFLAWAEGPPVFGRSLRWLRLAVYALVAAMWLLGALFLAGAMETGFWLIPLTLGLVLSFALSGPIQRTLDRAGGGQRAMMKYAGLIEHAVRAPDAGSRLGGLHARLAGDGAMAPACMRQLNRILGFGELRRGAAILHFPIQAVTLWDFHVIFALERWRTHAGAHVRGWLEAVAELDALTALAGVRRDNPDWCLPEVGATPTIEGTSIGHPLIPDGKRVTNDVSIGPPGTLLLVTGSNMSGKSTLLRAVGLNLVLAQAGGCAAAKTLVLPPCDLQTSIRVTDSLELGLSYFMAALARLKGVVDAAEHERPGRILVYLLDEILQGTNSVERGLAVRAVARHLLQAGAIGAMTTHDLSLAGEEPLSSAARLVHFTETVGENGEMRFDYRLRPGLATSRNALRLMKLIGIEP